MSTDNAGMDKSFYIEEMRSWLNRQSHLPKDLDDAFLYRFAHSCYFDLTKAKVALDMFLNLRRNSKEIMTNRDINTPQLKKALSIAYPAVYDLPDKTRLWVWQINDPGFDNYDFVAAVKLCMLLMDVVFLTDDDPAEADVVVFDTKDMNYKVMSTFSISLCRTVIKYQQEALPVRLKQIHFINTLPIVEKVYGLVKPFLSKELIEMFYFHTPNSKTLYDYVSKENLPVDIGGSLNGLKEEKIRLMGLLPSIGDAVFREDFWTAIGDKETDTSMDNGCFRSLNLD